MKILIATGASRTAKKWKNQETTWEKFLEKLRTTTRTRETMAEYMKMPKREQDRIKDVGGFVGGYLKNGRRLAGNVINRQLVCLDADFGDDSLLSTLDLFYADTTYAVYSTHKHTKDHPRLRIVFPLAKPVGPDAYQAIARRLASDIGMDLFDDTTYEAERLMYWPSTAAGGEYVFVENPGEFLDPDKVLALYDDWKDASTWPVSSRQTDIIIRNAQKQGDPLTKPGLVGAFCRAYSIPEAIEAFLPEEYTQTGKEDRYTYTRGSTTAGLVLYEDGKFAFSHHGTDPVSGKLVNSFDLVRIHRFRDRDVNAGPDTRVNDLPSYKAMCDLAAEGGMQHYEISNFALPGCQSRHNSSYWQGEPYFGFGPGAHSYDGRRTRRWNLPDLERYVAADSVPMESEVLSDDELYDEYIMTRLRTRQGADLSQLTARQRDYCMQMARPHLAGGRLRCEGTHLVLTQEGLFVSNDVISDLMC